MTVQDHLTIRLVVADDHTLIIEMMEDSLKNVPGIHLAGTARNGVELLALVEEKKPDVVLTDIQMPEMDGIEATRQIREKHPSVAIVGFSSFDDYFTISEMIEAGATGFIIKSAVKDEMIAAIKAVHNKERFYCKTITQKLAQHSEFWLKSGRLASLSERDKKIMQLTCQEFSNKEIADQLDTTPRAIESAKDRLKQKLKVKGTIGLAIYAIKNKIFRS